jgi:hypothetical protein
MRGQYSSVSIVTRLWAELLRSHISIPGRGKSFVACPKLPDWVWGLSNLLYSGYQRQGVGGMKLTTHPDLMPRLRISGVLLLLLHMLLFHTQRSEIIVL